jgi:rhodanese-related sulfurtransferase
MTFLEHFPLEDENNTYLEDISKYLRLRYVFNFRRRDAMPHSLLWDTQEFELQVSLHEDHKLGYIINTIGRHKTITLECEKGGDSVRAMTYFNKKDFDAYDFTAQQRLIFEQMSILSHSIIRGWVNAWCEENIKNFS